MRLSGQEIMSPENLSTKALAAQAALDPVFQDIHRNSCLFFYTVTACWYFLDMVEIGCSFLPGMPLYA